MSRSPSEAGALHSRDAVGPTIGRPSGTVARGALRRPIPRLERYRIDRLLGSGGMGDVWLAHDPMLDRAVAIKIVHPGNESTGRIQLERMSREARALARLSHPNVVGVFDVGTYAMDTGSGRSTRGLYIVMELVEGPTLARWLETPRTTLAIVDAFIQAGEGLAAAHDAGLIHRDFKPANVLVGYDGRVRVGDFGLARRGSEFDDDPRRILARTTADEIVETLYATLLGESDDPTERALIYAARGYTRMEDGDLDGAIEDARTARQQLPPGVIHRYLLTLTYGNEAEALIRRGACDEAAEVLARGLEWAGAEGLDAELLALSSQRDELIRTCKPGASL